MATFKATILKDNIRKDGTYNCVIRVTHNRKSKYIPTSLYVTQKQLTKTFEIKDPTVQDALNTIVKGYRERITKIADKIDYFDIAAIADYVTRSIDDIDFLEYGRTYASLMNKESSKSNYRTVLNALTDFSKSTKIPISSINAAFLKGFEKYLTSERKMVRVDRWGVERAVTEKPISARSVFNYMNAIKAIFNAARLQYNNEDVGDIRIPFYPFRTYKIPTPGKSVKRNLTAEAIREIRDSEGFARDIFMISFYLCGMNTIDIYHATTIRNGRIEYNRSKTSGKRADNAFISIKIEPELQVLLDKYADASGARVFNFHQRFKDSRNLTGYVNSGLKYIAPTLTTYYARHSWATIARNDCGVSKDVVGESLNHSSGNNVTDLYLARDWSSVDRANRAVIDKING